MTILCATIACLASHFPGATAQYMPGGAIFQTRDQTVYCQQQRDVYRCSATPVQQR